MINVGIDGHMLGDHSGGNESYYRNILNTISVPDNLKIYLFVRPGVNVDEYKDKFQIVYFKQKKALMRNFWELNHLCKKYNLKLLHTQYFIPFIRHCKVVCTIHDICFEHFKDIFTKNEYYRQKILVPYAAKHSEYVFTVSKHAKNDIVNYYRIPEDKIVITYNAVNSSFRKISDIELAEDTLRNKYQIGQGKYILSVSNLQPRKNLVRLIRAFVSMKKDRNSGEKLVIVGKKAWMFNDIIQTALEGSTDIIFTDYVNDNDLIRLYNAASCFVYPSYFEGFGIPPLEAMACGTPVAVANTTSLPEVVGDAGIYFDPFSEEEIKASMIKMLAENYVTNDLQIKMEAQVKRFSWKKSADLVIDTYKKCLTKIKN